jgi:hypothetical protein
LARMTRVKRSGLNVVFTALPEYAPYAEGLGPFLPMPVDLADLLEVVGGLLTPGS